MIEDEDKEIIYLTKIHREIKDQELRKKLYSLVRFVYIKGTLKKKVCQAEKVIN
ncbi:MAG: hypothetical protein ACR5KV_07085 [Wolbachia sp.]